MPRFPSCRIVEGLLLQGKKISCPTCRGGFRVADVAYVDNGRSQVEGDEETASSSAAQEAAIDVKGSYGTKVSSHNTKHCSQ